MGVCVYAVRDVYAKGHKILLLFYFSNFIVKLTQKANALNPNKNLENYNIHRLYLTILFVMY